MLRFRPARTQPVGRYAPSPTGELHLGNLRTALAAWRDCRASGSLFILRIEDIDTPRKVAGSELRILEDLRWLGIDWDEGPDVGGPAAPYRQSERSHLYSAAFDYLREHELIYPCRCSRKDLRSAPSAPHESEGAIYPGTCRPENGNPPAAGDEVAWRFRVRPDPLLEFADVEPGSQRTRPETEMGDFVVLRRDGLWAYQLACAVDDGLMGITRVVRGADLIGSTPRQIALLRALNLPVPEYRHLPLMLDGSGQRMSKRDGSLGLSKLREQGLSPGDVLDRLKLTF
ncbi:MAG: tRNA glutamyl-Q(34) synthetase GluQRS [Candidatus Sumerlaeaceae bacterium]